MGQLTTHVLDTSTGKPGQGISVDVIRIDGESRQPLTSALTNDDGRCDAPLLAGDAFTPGVYELTFDVGAYFAATHSLPEPAFLERVVIRFGVANAEQHYHVPLLISPFGYSTYRGS